MTVRRPDRAVESRGARAGGHPGLPVTAPERASHAEGAYFSAGTALAGAASGDPDVLADGLRYRSIAC